MSQTTLKKKAKRGVSRSVPSLDVSKDAPTRHYRIDYQNTIGGGIIYPYLERERAIEEIRELVGLMDKYKGTITITHASGST